MRKRPRVNLRNAVARRVERAANGDSAEAADANLSIAFDSMDGNDPTAIAGRQPYCTRLPDYGRNSTLSAEMIVFRNRAVQNGP